MRSYACKTISCEVEVLLEIILAVIWSRLFCYRSLSSEFWLAVSLQSVPLARQKYVIAAYPALSRIESACA